jgi:hypothetical protein
MEKTQKRCDVLAAQFNFSPVALALSPTFVPDGSGDSRSAVPTSYVPTDEWCFFYLAKGC